MNLFNNFFHSFLRDLELVPALKSPSTVVISSYSSLNSVFVRQLDDFWNEKFFRICNDVAQIANGGNKKTISLQLFLQLLKKNFF